MSLIELISLTTPTIQGVYRRVPQLWRLYLLNEAKKRTILQTVVKEEFVSLYSASSCCCCLNRTKCVILLPDSAASSSFCSVQDRIPCSRSRKMRDTTYLSVPVPDRSCDERVWIGLDWNRLVQVWDCCD
ncbi:hypothetical protein AVEN_50139-1 [Araneus ventricosus]|uniref:Uncharacterized protein n=1 Tax=Araneus ventricosus TaxID=182803 RepID=A0A4Y2DAG4_ARAVE|nr:hypothetical protein AVEN_50139-1 [Araneus ventricosus]